MTTMSNTDFVKRRTAFSTLLTVLSAMASRPSGLVGLILVAFHIVLAIVSPVIAPYDFRELSAQIILNEPSSEHWFGTDNLGRDVFTRTMLGGRQALLVTTISTILAISWGGLLGVLLGLVGGWLDELLMRLVDAFLCLPWILVLLLIVVMVGSGPAVLIPTLGFFYGIPVIRMARAATHDVVGVTADNVVVQSAAPQDANPDFATLIPRNDLTEYVARYSNAASAAEQRPVGRISGNPAAPGPATEETQLGNFIADAQLFATRDAGAQIAFMNNSGIRGAGLEPAADGTITFGSIYAVQPFGNTLVTKTFTGAQLRALLEQQFDDDGFVQTFSPSEGFALVYDMSRPVGSRIVSVTLDGKPIDPLADYRVTMNSFLAAGGDSFTVFKDGTDVVTGPVDLDAIEAYLAGKDMVALPATGRITAVG